MNLLLPGKPGRFAAPVRLVTFFTTLLLCMLYIPAFGAEDESDRRSGVVEPQVTSLNPFLASEEPRIEEFILPKKYSIPHGIAIDSKDRIWVTEMGANSLAVFDPASSTLKEYRIPSTEGLPESDWIYDPKKRTSPTQEAVSIYTVGGPGAVIVDSNDIIWFVMHLGNSVVRFDPAKEEFTEFIIPTPNSLPYDLAADSEGRIWFVEKNKGKLGYLDVEKKKSVEIDIGHGSNLMGIAIDSDGKIWIGDVTHNYIARYDPVTKKIRKFQISVPLSQPGQMRFDNNGILWICNLHSQQLGVLMPEQGAYSVVDLPGWNAVPQALAIANNDNIWIVDSMTNQIGFFNQTQLTWRLFSIPTANSQPMNIAIDSKGAVWFTQSDRNANRIARLWPSTIPQPQSAASAQGEGGDMADKTRRDSSKSDMIMFYMIGIGVLVVLFAGAFLFARRRSKP